MNLLRTRALGARAWRPLRTFTSSPFRCNLLREVEKQHQRVDGLLVEVKRLEASRDSKTFQPPTLKAFKENLWTVPNMLTMSRIATTPLIGYFIVNGRPAVASGIFVYSCITDFLDGYIARKYNLKSVAGSILDPMADKFLMTVSTVALSYQHIMPVPVAALIIGRDVMLSFWGFWVRYKTLDPPKTLKRFADLRQSAVSVHPNLLGKANTALQMVYIGALVMQPVVAMLGDFSGAFEVFGYVVGATTVASGASYVLSNRAVRRVR